MLTKNKNAQQEISGFVLIVVIVTIIGLGLLVLSIGRGEIEKPASIEISNLLESAMSYTTDCSINEGYRELGDLIKACYKNQNCYDNKNSCDVASSTLDSIISKSLVIGENSPNKAYNLSVYYSAINSTIKDEKIKIQEGIFANCTSKIGASTSLLVSSMDYGIINIELEVCRVV